MFTCLAKLLERLKFKKVRHLEREDIHIRVSIETIYYICNKVLNFQNNNNNNRENFVLCYQFENKCTYISKNWIYMIQTIP